MYYYSRRACGTVSLVIGGFKSLCEVDFVVVGFLGVLLSWAEITLRC